MNRLAIVATLGVLAALVALTSRPIERGATERGATERVVAKRGVIAERGYERRLHGHREAVMRVTWSWADHNGQKVIRDITEVRSRSKRMMLSIGDVFETDVTLDLLRTESGELISMTTTVQLASRTDTEIITRTENGYRVRTTAGDNEDSFEVPTDAPVYVDAEAFLLPKIRSGEAKAGVTYTLRLLATAQRKVIESKLIVVGQDDEGPGLKVEQITFGRRSLWWFAPDGTVMRIRNGDTVTTRADHLGLDDLPRTPAAYPVTLPSDIDLPRLFTGKRMVVDVEVKTDDTVKPPKIPPNPFTETIETGTGRVRLLLKSHDDRAANVALPIDAKGLEEYLKATPLMEVDDPKVKRHARLAMRGAEDARTAAANIADYVFRLLRKGSSNMAEPTALQILDDPAGDCSEHCLLFTTLCRAAGIPARRCSGYVCIGGDWGGHAWCEIWVGKWIGADPTTNEIGTRARYIFCGRPDDPTVVRAQLTAARTKISIRSAEYADGALVFDKGKVDPETFSGIRFAKLPDGWRVARAGADASILTDEFRVDARIEPDQGRRSLDILSMMIGGGDTSTFGGRPAVRRSYGRYTIWIVPLGRQNLTIRAATRRRGATLPTKLIEAAFKPTLDRDDG